MCVHMHMYTCKQQLHFVNVNKLLAVCRSGEALYVFISHQFFAQNVPRLISMVRCHSSSESNPFL